MSTLCWVSDSDTAAWAAMWLAFSAGMAGMLVEIAVARMLGPIVGMTQDSWAALI